MKSKVTAYLLLIFLGPLGAHKFYLKKTGIGILYLLTFGLFGFGWLYDLFTLGRQVDVFNNPELAVKPSENENHPHVEIIRHTPEPKPERKPVNEKQVDYRPLLDLCAEIENKADNDYIPFDPPIPAEVEYCDYDGEASSRAIDVRYIAKSDYNDGYYIRAFCHLRNEDRTFKVERIQKTITNGKSVDFVRHLVDTYRGTDKYKETILSVKTRKLLNSSDTIGYSARILTYISRIDGIFTRKEKTVIAAFLKELDNNQNEDLEIENYVEELAGLAPTTAEYKNMVKIADISEDLIKKAKEIIGKDPLRQGAFEILNKQFEKNKN